MLRNGLCFFSLNLTKNKGVIAFRCMSHKVPTIHLTHVHRGVDFHTGMRAVMKVAMGTSGQTCTLVERTAEKVVLQKVKAVKHADLLRLAKIPSHIQFTEVWTMETNKTPPRMLMQTTVDMSLCIMRIATMYECVACEDGTTDLCVHTKMHVDGIDDTFLVTIITMQTEMQFKKDRVVEANIIAEEQRVDQVVR